MLVCSLLNSLYNIFISFPRFHLNFQETTDGDDGSDIDTDEGSRLSFASISKTAGFLDKELAASGFTRKDQVVIQKVM